MSNGWMTRRRLLVLVLSAVGLLAVATAAVIVILVRSLLPSEDAAARNAQATADVVAPYIIVVESAEFSGGRHRPPRAHDPANRE